MHKVVINGVTYGNVAKIDDEIEEEYYHQETALDGTLYQELRYRKTHHTVQFFNLLDGVYESLKAYIKANQDTPITCGIPDNADGFAYDDYYLTIADGEINKGYLRDNYYRTGVTVKMKKVNADE